MAGITALNALGAGRRGRAILGLRVLAGAQLLATAVVFFAAFVVNRAWTFTGDGGAAPA